MNDLFFYLHSHKDLSLKEYPFSDVDALILSSFVYVKFDQIEDGTLVKELDISHITEKECHMKEDLRLLKAFVKTKRFGTLQIKYYTSILRESTQYGAVVLEDDENVFIVFRGTDNTLEGWLEDFNMAFTSYIPSQAIAYQYTEKVLSKVEGKRVFIMGHSKGGNLALFSYLNLDDEQKEKVEAVYNLDGPGFSEYSNMAQKLAKEDDKINTFVPSGTVIGMLLEHGDRYRVVKSRNFGIMQHDLYSWRLKGNELWFVKDRDRLSYKKDALIHSFLSSLSANDRAEFVSLIFKHINKKGYKDFDEVLLNFIKDLNELLKNYKTLDSETKSMITKCFSALYLAEKKNDVKH